MPTKDEIQTFSLLIEEMASNMGCTRLDAILYHCDDIGLEIEIASTLISPALKGKIEEESQKENMIKKSSRLPI